MFRRVSVFAGGWSVEAAESVCVSDGLESSDVFDLLSHLVEKSGVTPFWWTFRMSRAETRENVHDDSASETLIYTRVQSTHG